MILYVNGDSHSAGAEAVNSYAFAEDDSKYHALGRKPHPDNLVVSYGYKLAQALRAELNIDAESASSNDRIIRSTREYLKTTTPDLIVIGWTSWEREEWWHEQTGKYWQVNAWFPGSDWPREVQERHRDWVITVDHDQKRREWNQKIWDFHQEIAHIPHLFFNTFSGLIKEPEYEWGSSYDYPYNKEGTYYEWCLRQGFNPVSKNSYHFGADAHSAWADYLYPKIIQNCLTAK